MSVTNVREKAAVDTTRRELVLVAAVYLPVSLLMTVLAAVLAVRGAGDTLPVPAWWVLVGIGLVGTGQTLHELWVTGREYRLITRCSICLDAAVQLDAAQECWDAVSAQQHPHRPALVGGGAR